jgi:3-hydroxyisobutyrate dehydrogenase-like beta-hydroxyacid dehydrogenase
MRMPRPTVAVLGTGRIGAAVAHMLLTVGFAVRVWNRGTERVAGVVAAGAGRLLVLAAGAEHARERVQPIFDTIGRRTVWAFTPAYSASSPGACDRGPATELGAEPRR